MDIGVEIMKKRNKKLTELLVQRRALCDKMTHGVPGCSTDCKLFALRATARACRDSVLEDPARASELMQAHFEERRRSNACLRFVASGYDLEVLREYDKKQEAGSNGKA